MWSRKLDFCVLCRFLAVYYGSQQSIPLYVKHKRCGIGGIKHAACFVYHQLQTELSHPVDIVYELLLKASTVRLYCRLRISPIKPEVDISLKPWKPHFRRASDTPPFFRRTQHHGQL